MLQTATLQFLKALKKNNNKSWFDLHRNDYDNAKEDFAVFVQAVIDKHGINDPTIKNFSAKECTFRINRDIRFSKDKSPYKTNFGASFNKGRKNTFILAGYYFHLEPGQSFCGGGLYHPMPDSLKKVRQEIDYNYADFKKIISTRKFKSVFGDLDKSSEFLLSRVPKGYEPNNPAADYLKLKSFIAMTEISDTQLTSKDLVKKTVSTFQTLQPLIEFFNAAIE